MAEARAIAHFSALVLMNIAAVVVSAALFALLADAMDLATCSSSYLTVTCDIPRAGDFQWSAHVILLLIAAASLITTVMALYRFSIAPFFMFMLATLIFCLGFDLIFHLPVKNLSRLFSSTFNLASFIIFFSFIFMIAITPFNVAVYRLFFTAMMQSYLARDLAFLFYVAIQWVYIGMTSLYLMFVAFSFGAFTIHIMSIAVILRRSGELRRDDVTPQ
jgi:hypothetical protein